MRRIVLFVLLLFTTQLVWGQQMSESYYAQNPQEEVDDSFVGDTLHFYTPFVHQPRFERIARYSLYYAGYRRRADERADVVRIGNLPLNSPLMRYGDNVATSFLRRIPTIHTYTYSTSAPHEEQFGRGEHFDISLASLAKSSSLRANYSDRNYRFGADFRTVDKMKAQGWLYSVAAGGRLGRDANITGVYNNNAYAWSAFEKVLPEDDWGYVGHIVAALLIPYSERAPRSWNSAEVFDLSDNLLYNSNWGYQSGRVRPARVKSECVPTLYVAWRLSDRYDLGNDVAVELLARAGRRQTTSLDWSEATNPLPDHYTHLPSWQGDHLLAEEISQVWQTGDERYTQIDWPLLYDTNRLSDRGAIYALMADREDVREVMLNFSTAKGRDLWSHDRLPNPESPSMGRFNGWVSYHSSRNRNLPTDLLGATRLAEGYKLYDYRVNRWAVGCDIGASFSGDYGTLGLGARGELQSLTYRNDKQQRAVAVNDLFDLSAKATWHYSFGWNNTIGSVVYYNFATPFWGDLFASSEGSMTLNPYATGEHTGGGELWARWSLGRVGVSLNLYADLVAGRSQATNFWNDVAGCYCTFMAGGIDILSVGAELSCAVPLGGGFEAEGIVALGTSRYTSPAVADIVAHDGGEMVAHSFDILVEGQRASSSPEVAVVGRVSGELWNDWWLTLEAALCAERYVAPSLYYCSDYLHGLNLSPETRTALLAQENLGVAPNLGFTLRKDFDRVSLSLSARNLAGGGRTLYGAYRPNRLIVRENSEMEYYAPHATRYQYTYPPHITISIGYDF